MDPRIPSDCRGMPPASTGLVLVLKLESKQQKRNPYSPQGAENRSAGCSPPKCTTSEFRLKGFIMGWNRNLWQELPPFLRGLRVLPGIYREGLEQCIFFYRNDKVIEMRFVMNGLSDDPETLVVTPIVLDLKSTSYTWVERKSHVVHGMQSWRPKAVWPGHDLFSFPTYMEANHRIYFLTERPFIIHFYDTVEDVFGVLEVPSWLVVASREFRPLVVMPVGSKLHVYWDYDHPRPADDVSCWVHDTADGSWVLKEVPRSVMDAVRRRRKYCQQCSLAAVLGECLYDPKGRVLNLGRPGLAYVAGSIPVGYRRRNRAYLTSVGEGSSRELYIFQRTKACPTHTPNLWALCDYAGFDLWKGVMCEVGEGEDVDVCDPVLFEEEGGSEHEDGSIKYASECDFFFGQGKPRDTDGGYLNKGNLTDGADNNIHDVESCHSDVSDQEVCNDALIYKMAWSKVSLPIIEKPTLIIDGKIYS